MDGQSTGGRFQTTSWTSLARARSDPEELARLAAAYWSPVYAYLRRRGHDPHDAEDLTQGFLADVVLKRDLFGRADPDRGRFRTYLLAALKCFVVDEHRRDVGRGGARPREFVPDDPAALGAAEPSREDDPARAFDRQWATTVLSITLGRVRQACAEEGLGAHWTVFERRVLDPICSGGDRASVEGLVRAVGARDRDEVYSMQNSVKRKFRATLREVVSETAPPADVDDELAELRKLLSL